MVVVGHALSNTSDIAMAQPSGWLPIGQTYSNGSTYDTNLAGWYKFMGASPDSSVVVNGVSGAAFGTIGGAHAFRGVDPNDPFDVAAVASQATGTSRPNPASVMPLTQGAWPVVIGAGSAAAGAVFTAPIALSTGTNHFRSLNHAETNDIALGIGFKTDWASGAFDCPEFGGGNVNAANSSAALAFVLRPLQSTTHQGAAAASGAGTLAASGGRSRPGSAAVSGSGATSFIAGIIRGGRAALSGAGSAVATATRTARASVAVAGSGASALAARMAANARSDLSAVGSLVARAGRVFAGAVSALGESGLAANATRGAAGSAELTGTGAVAANGEVPGQAGTCRPNVRISVGVGCGL